MESTIPKLLFTLADVCDHYEQFRPSQMEHFARFVLSKGYGAMTPHGRRNPATGKKERETWQACGRRLYGERFVSVMDRMIAEHKTAVAAPDASQAIPDPEF